ncbi:hypothetical protein [Kitasatospora sp. NPDC059827]|uniref:hypothetical protein n=1 Tax=Kitasatospora sp. NPDC059827 TaxID=3346964 RepID=UPI00366170E0
MTEETAVGPLPGEPGSEAEVVYDYGFSPKSGAGTTTDSGAEATTFDGLERLTQVRTARRTTEK